MASNLRPSLKALIHWKPRRFQTIVNMILSAGSDDAPVQELLLVVAANEFVIRVKDCMSRFATTTQYPDLSRRRKP
jgi:hypothetical protein